MQEKKIQNYRSELEQLAEQASESGELEYDAGDTRQAEIMSRYKIKSPVGKLVYESFSEEELCSYLQRRAKALGHVPAQKEVYWVYQMYIKKRFGNWPRALKRALLSTKAGSGGSSYKTVEEREQQCNELLERVRRRGEELHRPPHMAEMKDCIEVLRYRYDTWSQVLAAAGIDGEWKRKHMLFKADGLSREEELLLESIRARAEELHRPPLRREIDEETRKRLQEKCITWRNILYQIGMEPVEKRKFFAQTYLDEKKNRKKRHAETLSSGLYKVSNLTAEQRDMVRQLRKTAKELGRAPIKEELPEELCHELVTVCGSYKNMLYQAGIEPADKVSIQKIRKKLRKKRPHAAE